MPGPHCVIVPFYNRVEQVRHCLIELLSQATPGSQFLLVDDASTEPVDALLPFLERDDVTLLTHPRNEGVSAARNSAIDWCRERGCEVLIMIDSDCLPGPDFVQTHLALHRRYPDAACIGGAIIGYGKTLWSRLDGVASWVHAAPHYAMHEVRHPYHLPTTNFSLKVSLLPERKFIFDERLYTGEDCLLIREYRRRSQRVLFSPTPTIRHRDRDALSDVVRHHYKWGHHQYLIQLGRDISDYVFNPAYRLFFLLVFLPAWPFYALAGAALNLLPWLRRRPAHVLYAPAMYCLWLAKGVAVMEAAMRPGAVMRPGRRELDYRIVASIQPARACQETGRPDYPAK